MPVNALDVLAAIDKHDTSVRIKKSVRSILEQWAAEPCGCPAETTSGRCRKCQAVDALAKLDEMKARP